MRTPKMKGIPFHDNATTELQEKIGEIDRLFIRVGAVNTPMLPSEDAHRIQTFLRELTRCLVFEVMERQKEEKQNKGREQE